MNNISLKIRGYLLHQGASLVGFANLSEIEPQFREGLPYGISIALALDPEKVKDIGNGAASGYYEEYRKINTRLNELALLTEEFIKALGLQAMARTQKVVHTNQTNKRSDLPYKTLATRAGLGWIGKSALCITPQFGAAQRFTAVLTDAPLDCGTPINDSHCGECRECQNICPAQAVSGTNWQLGLDRDQFFKAMDCHRFIIEFGKTIGRSEVSCGRCIKACPWTLSYINRGSCC